MIFEGVNQKPIFDILSLDFPDFPMSKMAFPCGSLRAFHFVP